MSGFCARREMAAARQETAAVRRVPRRKTGVDRAKKCPPNSFCRRACILACVEGPFYRRCGRYLHRRVGRPIKMQLLRALLAASLSWSLKSESPLADRLGISTSDNNGDQSSRSCCQRVAASHRLHQACCKTGTFPNAVVGLDGA